MVNIEDLRVDWIDNMWPLWYQFDCDVDDIIGLYCMGEPL
jgi:hypothetical protein